MGEKETNLDIFIPGKGVIEKLENKFISSLSHHEKLIKYHDKNDVGYFTQSGYENFGKCGNFLNFLHDVKKDTTTMVRANHCKNFKLCSACATRRAYQQRKKILGYLDNKPELYKKHWYYIVLTVKHDSSMSLTEVEKKLRDGAKKIRQKLSNKRRGTSNRDSFFGRFEGFITAEETTITKNGWNVHLNLLGYSNEKILLKKKGKTFISEDLANEWLLFTGDSFIVSCNEVKMDTDAIVRENLAEIFKYSVKPLALAPRDLFHYADVNKGKRLLSSMGSLYNLKLKETDLDTKIDNVTDFIDFYCMLGGVKSGKLEYSRIARHIHLEDPKLKEKVLKYCLKNKIQFIDTKFTGEAFIENNFNEDCSKTSEMFEKIERRIQSGEDDGEYPDSS